MHAGGQLSFRRADLSAGPPTAQGACWQTRPTPSTHRARSPTRIQLCPTVRRPPVQLRWKSSSLISVSEEAQLILRVSVQSELVYHGSFCGRLFPLSEN